MVIAPWVLSFNMLLYLSYEHFLELCHPWGLHVEQGPCFSAVLDSQAILKLMEAPSWPAKPHFSSQPGFPDLFKISPLTLSTTRKTATPSLDLQASALLRSRVTWEPALSSQTNSFILFLANCASEPNHSHEPTYFLVIVGSLHC